MKYCILLLLMAFSFPAMAIDRMSIADVDTRTGFPGINVKLEIKDGWDFPAGSISPDQVTVIEDGHYLGDIEVLPVPAPRSIGLLVAFDTSRSIRPSSLARMKRQALEFFRRVPSGVRITLMTFDDTPLVLLDGYPSIQRIEDAIAGIERHGKRTLLYNSLYDGVEILERNASPRKIVLAFTDGRDEGSRVAESDLRKFFRDAGVVLHVVCSGHDGSSCGSILRGCVEESGGTLRTISSRRRMKELYEEMLGNLPVSFGIRYTTSHKADNSLHSIEVRLKSNDLRLRTSTDVRYQVLSPLDQLRALPVKKLVAPCLVLLFILLLFLFLYFLRKFYQGRTSGREAISPVPGREEYDYENFSETGTERPENIPCAEVEEGDTDYISAWLMEKHGPELSGRLPLDSDEITLGSDEANSIAVKTGDVSPFHARIRQVDGSYYIFDLVSDKGTFLNGKKLLRPRCLHDWDEISLGTVTFVFRGQSSPSGVE